MPLFSRLYYRAIAHLDHRPHLTKRVPVCTQKLDGLGGEHCPGVIDIDRRDPKAVFDQQSDSAGIAVRGLWAVRRGPIESFLERLESGKPEIILLDSD